LDKAFALDVPMQWKPLVAWTVVMVAGVGAFDYSYAWICERLGIKLNEQLAIKLFNLPNLTGFELAAVFLMGALILPVLEEVVFRGIAYQSLRTKANPWLAIPVSAAIFAAVHMDISAFLPIFVCGCALAYAFERTKNLRLPILIHCLNNIIALTCTLLERS
jgi:membrane protease YdiL (CAAX protease family)